MSNDRYGSCSVVKVAGKTVHNLNQQKFILSLPRWLIDEIYLKKESHHAPDGVRKTQSAQVRKDEDPAVQ